MSINDTSVADNKAKLNGYGITTSTKFFFIEKLNDISELIEKKQASFETVGDEVYCQIDGLKYNVQTIEELVILKEIFIDGIYNLHTKDKYILIDIGMNVAFTSLFFAIKPQCETVYSYEPFGPTFEQAKRNISLNPSIKNKINAYNFGLGKSDEKLEWDYNLSFKGSMGVNGLPFYLKNSIAESEIKKIPVKINKAVDVLSSIIQKHNKDSIIVKIDCEGAEYDIIESLYESDLLKNINTILLEWHLKGPNEPERILIDNQFKVVSFHPVAKGTGMIYAFK